MRIKSVKRLEIWLEFEFYQIKRGLQKNVSPLLLCGSPARIRTADPVVNPAAGGTLPAESANNG